MNNMEILHHAQIGQNAYTEYVRTICTYKYINIWQQNYNAIPTHLISEDVMKAELHHRVDVSI